MNNLQKRQANYKIRMEWKMRAIWHRSHIQCIQNIFQRFLFVVAVAGAAVAVGFLILFRRKAATTTNDNGIAKTIRTYVLYVLMNMCFRQIVLYQMKPIRDEPIDSDELHLRNYKNDYIRNWTTSTVHCTTMYTIHSFRFVLILSAIEQCSMFNRL